MLKYFILLFAILCGIGGDVFLKISPGKFNMNLLYGFLMFGLAALPVSYLFKTTDFSSLAIIWSCVALILMSLIGFAYYKETFSLNKILAIILALVAAILAER